LPGYFLDTSALAKLYHAETGSDSVDRIFSETGSRHYISRLSIVEMESVFAIKSRIGQVDLPSLLLARRRLEVDLALRRLLVAGVYDAHFRAALQLLFQYGLTESLRTLDALQLSVAVGLKRAGLATVFVAADQKLCRVAVCEGFIVVNPEQPASVVI
jgi:predicted nucleic acid-binding protein